jgi:DNA mismatch endonuclease (patch repair protein)
VKRKTANFSGRNFQKTRNPDRLSKKRRSSLMARIRSKGTRFEEGFFELLRTAKIGRFTKNCNLILGKPDIVFYKYRVCVFLDSDFWHGWQYPRWKHLLKDDFWRSKIEGNRLRDKIVTRTLRREGWVVIRIWEHSIKFGFAAQLSRIQSACYPTK